MVYSMQIGKEGEVDQSASQLQAALRQIVGTQSQAEVARRVGVSQATISRLLKGQRRGSMYTAGRLLAAYPELGPFFVPANIPNSMSPCSSA
jgi:transcriptional regulator with XRE-family HTH domain